MKTAVNKIFKKKLDYKFTAIKNYMGHSYLIDSCDTFDAGYELMVFKVKGDLAQECEDWQYEYTKTTGTCVPEEVYDNVEWDSLYVHYYDSLEEAEEHFKYIVNNFDSFMEKEVLSLPTKPFLKPCPFCGSETLDLDSYHHTVECGDCGVEMIGVSLENAIENWNKRV